VQKCVVVAAASIKIGLSIKEERDTLTMAMSSCKMESCMVRIVVCGGIGLSIKKHVDALMMTIQ